MLLWPIMVMVVVIGREAALLCGRAVQARHRCAALPLLQHLHGRQLTCHAWHGELEMQACTALRCLPMTCERLPQHMRVMGAALGCCVTAQDQIARCGPHASWYLHSVKQVLHACVHASGLPLHRARLLAHRSAHAHAHASARRARRIAAQLACVGGMMHRPACLHERGAVHTAQRSTAQHGAPGLRVQKSFSCTANNCCNDWLSCVHPCSKGSPSQQSAMISSHHRCTCASKHVVVSACNLLCVL